VPAWLPTRRRVAIAARLHKEAQAELQVLNLRDLLIRDHLVEPWVRRKRRGSRARTSTGVHPVPNVRQAVVMGALCSTRALTPRSTVLAG